MMSALRDERGGRKAGRRALSLLFSVAVHGALAGTIFGLSVNKVQMPPERVYRVSLAELTAPEPPAAGGPSAAAEEAGPPEPPAPAPPPPPKPKPPKPRPQVVKKKPDPPKPAPVKRISAKKRQEKEREKPKPKPREVAVETTPTPAPRREPRPAASEHASSSSSHSTTSGLARPLAGGTGTGRRTGGRTGMGAGSGASGRGRGASGTGVNPNAVYSQDRVDQRPAMTRAVAPQYPQRARRMGVEGRVMVKLVVDKSGSPRNCAVASARPPGYFEEAAVSAACRSRFSPGKIRGQPVNTMVVVPFAFRLH